MSTIENLVQEVRQDFLKRNRDLLSLVKSGPEDVMRRLTSALSLDAQAQADVSFYVDVVDQKGMAGETARADFKRELGKAVCKAFLKVLRNGAIEFITRLTNEAETQFEDIEIVAGERDPRPVVPPPPPALSAAEQLEAEIRSDWDNLSTVEIRRKCNNKRYKAEFTRLMDAGALRSLATTYTDNGVEFRK